MCPVNWLLADKALMNDEEPAGPKFVGKCNDPYVMRTVDTCHILRDGQVLSWKVTYWGNLTFTNPCIIT
jgi:hypothetical protein